MKDVLYLQTTTSTNEICFEMAQKGALHGFSVIAGAQTGGRGRLGKKWQSVPGKGLYCSIILRPKLALIDYPKITMTAGLGVAEALDFMTGLHVSLKWPNDIYYNGKKCCGILSESSPANQEEGRGFAVVGIGVNVNTEVSEFPEEIESSATSLHLESGEIYDLKEVFEEIRTEVLSHVQELEKDGFVHILERWKERDMLHGKWLEWVANSGKIIFGKSLGPDATGQLIVRDSEGKTHEVLSGDIQLAKKNGLDIKS